MICNPALRYERRIQLSIPHATGAEMQYVKEAFASNWLSTVGPNLTALEQGFSELVGVPAVALGSGTAGIHLGLKLLNLKPGDEVVTPTLTFVASANPVLYERAVPVFVDSERTSWNLDPERLAGFLKKRARVNRLPRALIVVHLYGRSAELESILRLCREYQVPMLEDAAHALGTLYRGRQVGAWGDVGVFSLGGNKVVTATAGGILVSGHLGWTARARFLSTQARDPDPDGLNGYFHSEVGYNYRLSNVLAGIARGQLPVLELRVRQRRTIFEHYWKGFEDLCGIEPQSEPENHPAGPQSQHIQEPSSPNDEHVESLQALHCSERHTRWLSCFLIQEQEFGMSVPELIRFLDAANVEARPVWKPMHTQPLYRGYECIGGEVSEDLNRRGICLPSSSCLTEVEQRFVIDRVLEAHQLAKPV